jgi:hypothetical protein
VYVKHFLLVFKTHINMSGGTDLSDPPDLPDLPDRLDLPWWRLSAEL